MEICIDENQFKLRAGLIEVKEKHTQTLLVAIKFNGLKLRRFSSAMGGTCQKKISYRGKNFWYQIVKQPLFITSDISFTTTYLKKMRSKNSFHQQDAENNELTLKFYIF